MNFTSSELLKIVSDVHFNTFILVVINHTSQMVQCLEVLNGQYVIQVNDNRISDTNKGTESNNRVHRLSHTQNL